MSTTKIIESVDLRYFKEIILKRKGVINISSHALDHLSDAQRKVYRKDDLIDPLLKETPAGVGLQKNGRYAVFFKRKDYYLRLIIDVKDSKIEIITFINTEIMPNIRRTEDEKR